MHKGNFGKNSLLQQKLFILLYFIIPNGNLFFTSVKSGVQTLLHETWKKACVYNDFQQEKSKCNMNKKVKWRFSSCLISHLAFSTTTTISCWQQSSSHPWIWVSNIALWQSETLTGSWGHSGPPGSQWDLSIPLFTSCTMLMDHCW